MYFQIGDHTRHIGIWIVCLLVAFSSSAQGASRFSIGPFLGLHRPVVEDLNEGEFKSPISGIATIVNFVDDTQTPEKIFIENPLPNIGVGANMGLELQWAYNDKYSCPIPPDENKLDCKVEAGIKKYH